MHAVARDWRTAPLSDADRALCEFGVKLMRLDGPMSEEDLDRLREHGFDDTAVHDAVQVVAYFALMVRVAEGLGVEAEDFIPPWGGEDGAGAG